MKKILIFGSIIMVVSLAAGGCAKRISIRTVEKERVDQNLIEGNKGFVSGELPPPLQSKPRVTTRKIYQVTFEVPPYPEWKNFRPQRTEDKDIWGNRGYIYGGPQSVSKEEVSKPKEEQEAIVLPEESRESEKQQPMMQKEVQPSEPVVEQVTYKTYKVKKGDTLQKISRKFYGTTKRWKKIFDFNDDILKSPNKIYPGQKLKIPKL